MVVRCDDGRKQMNNSSPKLRLITRSTAGPAVDTTDAALNAGHKVAAGARSRSGR
jgi:hypothetical protein